MSHSRAVETRGRARGAAPIRAATRGGASLCRGLGSSLVTRLGPPFR